MKQRTLKVLYNILYEYYIQTEYLTYLCNAIHYLRGDFGGNLITDLEYDKLIKHFKKQYPTDTQYKEIYNNPLFNKMDIETEEEKEGLDDRVWFIGYEGDTRLLRIKFLEAILLKLA